MTELITVASLAQAAAYEAQAAAHAANEAVAMAQEAEETRVRAAGLQYGVNLSAWEWVEYAGRSARQAQDYADRCQAATQVDDALEADRYLKLAQAEAYNAWGYAGRCGVTHL